MMKSRIRRKVYLGSHFQRGESLMAGEAEQQPARTQREQIPFSAVNAKQRDKTRKEARL